MARQPVLSVYVIIAVPYVPLTVTPDTMPEDEPIVATEGSLLLHVPPDGVLFNVVVDDSQT